MKPIQSVEILLDKPRHLRLDMLALFEAEREINKIRGNTSPVSIFSLIQREFVPQGGDLFSAPMDLMLILFWASMLHEDPELTVKAAGELGAEPIVAMKAVMDTLGLCVFGPNKEAGGEGPGELPLARPNGSQPSRSDGSS